MNMLLPLNIPPHQKHKAAHAENREHYSFGYLLRIEDIPGDPRGHDAQPEQLQESAQLVTHSSVRFLKTRSKSMVSSQEWHDSSAPASLAHGFAER